MWAEFWAVCPVPLGGVSLLALTVLVTVASPNAVQSQGGRYLLPSLLSQGPLSSLRSFVIPLKF